MSRNSTHDVSAGKAPASGGLTKVSRIVHFTAIGILVILLFGPAFVWAGRQLDSGDEPWQLILVPFLSLMVISQRVPELPKGPLQTSALLAFPLMLVGALMNLFGIIIEHPLPSQAGMIVFLHGAVLLLWGRRIYRGLAFPLFYLFLAVPLPRTVLVALTGSLKIFGAAVAGKILSLMGFAVLREGAVLNFPTFTLVVADECSGLQSLITLSVASLPVAYLMESRFWKRALIVLISFPLALAVNVVRLCVTAVLGEKFGESVTEGWPHTTIGMVIVFAAFFALYAFSSLLSDKPSPGESAGRASPK
jgi:exosortase